MANVQVYPEVEDLRDLDARMRAALSTLLQSEAENISKAPWYRTQGVDLATYITQAVQAIGIDAVVTAAGYPEDAITGICNMLEGQSKAAETLGEGWTYTANFGYDDGNQSETSARYKRSKMVYALLPETRPTGSLANLFRESVSIMELDPHIADDAQFGWQQVTSLNYAFYLSTVLPIMSISLDIPLCTNIAYFGGNFHEIAFKNARRLSSITWFAYSNAFLKAIRNWNLANVISASQPLPSKPVLETITFDGLAINDEDGTATWAGGDEYYCDADDATAVNYIRNGMVMGKATASSQSNIARSTSLNAETLLALVYMAYDWTLNPLGLTRRTDPTIGTEDVAAMLTYDFTADQKRALHEAYPKINVRRILSEKGWVDIDPNGDYWSLQEE